MEVSMTALVDDPLISRMAISRTLPLHESSRRLRELYPECPRVYGVAVMGDLTRRRWWPLSDALDGERIGEGDQERAAVRPETDLMEFAVVVGKERIGQRVRNFR
jgi:hypothetical protein